MAKIETHTTHTVKLTWKCSQAPDKDDLIYMLKKAIPNCAHITNFSAAVGPDKDLAPMQTLTITYVGGVFGGLGRF